MCIFVYPGGIMFICGIATIGAAFVPEGIAATVLLIISLCSGCAASILAAIAVDVFPTQLRLVVLEIGCEVMKVKLIDGMRFKV